MVSLLHIRPPKSKPWSSSAEFMVVMCCMSLLKIFLNRKGKRFGMPIIPQNVSHTIAFQGKVTLSPNLVGPASKTFCFQQ